MSLALLSLGALLVSPAQAGRRVSPEVLQAPLRIGVELEVSGRTRLTRVSDGSPVQDPALASLGELAWTGDLVLELRLARRFRDGSMGWLVRVLEAGRETDPAAGLPPSPWSLRARSFELRTFDDGEVLSFEPGRELVGEDRLGGLADLLGPLLSPHAPALKVDQSLRRTTRWALLPGLGDGLRMRVIAEWRALQRDKKAGTWRLAWSGPVDGRGREALPLSAEPSSTEAVRVSEVRGEASGELLILDIPRMPVPLRLVEHDLRLSRSLSMTFPQAVGGPIDLVQDQILRARSRVLAREEAPAEDPLGGVRAPQHADPLVADRSPLDRYVDSPRALAAMAALAEGMAPCVQGLPDGAFPLRLWIAGTGLGLSLETEGAPAEVEGCLNLSRQGLRLSPTDDEQVELRGSVLLHSGRAQAGPGVHFIPRRAELDLLLLPWWEGAAAAQERFVALGLQAPVETFQGW